MIARRLADDITSDNSLGITVSSPRQGSKVAKNDRRLPEVVRELRRRLQLTQEKFAARLGVTFPTINRWENGRSLPSPLARQRIRELLLALGKEGNDLVKKYFPEEGQE